MDDRKAINAARIGGAALVAACVAMGAAAACATTRPDDGAPEAAQPGTITTADDLLVALEKADRDIRTISAQVLWINVAGEIEGQDKQVRRGQLYFADNREPEKPAAAAPPHPDPADGTTPPKPAGNPKPPVTGATEPGRYFQVRFDTIEADGKQWTEARTFILRGEWFIEKLEQQKQMFKRRVIAPGEKIDPLRIGEGPFPVPIGQKRADIIARFTAEMVPSLDGLPVEKMKDATKERYNDSYQLKLTPRPGTQEAKDFREVRFWYTKSNLVPMHVKTMNTSGGSDEVVLANIKVNEKLPEGVFDISSPEGWNVQIEEYRKSADEKK